MNIFQIGTCKGNDDLTNIINRLPDKNVIKTLVLVEPMSRHNEDIKDLYADVKNKHIENIAINTDEGVEEELFYYHKGDGPLYEIASLKKSHITKHSLVEAHLKHHDDEIVTFKVKAMTVNNLFEKYNVSHIDLLFIDAEGLDSEIIRSIDFGKFTIERIIFENLHLVDIDLLEYKLAQEGYRVNRRVGANGWSNEAVLW